ncbi:MAG TPA: biotin--[acetyl-CoA-carboxylase] ligase [Phycisphaerales bacterium]|nr:biotin--[acetyl-CoA-carboxylase] ligase [Phycisphaerales bacterium]
MTDRARKPEPLDSWPDRLEAACAAHPALGVAHVRVLAETASTQDAAWQASAGRPGWLVIAGRQTAGRGRLGRAWADDAGHGLAMTLTLPAGTLSSVAVGLAVCRAANATLPEPLLGLRWPNDVVERADTGRKIAGVLTEARGSVALVGIGVNVSHRGWPDQLRTRAASLHELGADCTRVQLACAIVGELAETMRRDGAEIAREASVLNTLCGTARRFVHDGREHVGVVESISPDGSIHLRTPQNGSVRLPAQTTSLVHE